MSTLFQSWLKGGGGFDWSSYWATLISAEIEAGDEFGLSGPENDPKTFEALRKATMLRYDAIKPVYTAYTAVREIVTRGKDFGIDQRDHKRRDATGDMKRARRRVPSRP